MSQISPPIRIVLVAAVAFLAAWMLFLRPQADEVVPPAEPAPNVQTSEAAITGPGKAAEAAQGAVQAADGQLQAQESVDGVDAGESAAGTQAGTGTATEAATPQNAADVAKAELKGLPEPVVKAIARQKVLVILFWSNKSADDQAVRAAVRKVDRWDGRVFVHAAPIKSIAKWGRIARGVDVEQSPTVVVADANLRADTLVGYVDTQTIDQAVVDALRATGSLYTSAYLRRIDRVCARYGSAIWARPNADRPSQVRPALVGSQALTQRFHAAFVAIPAPKRYRPLKRTFAGHLADMSALMGEWIAYLGPKPTAARVVGSGGRFMPRLAQIGVRGGRAMDEHNVLACGSGNL